MAVDDTSPSKQDDRANRITLLGALVCRYAWCRIPSAWFYSTLPDYLLVVQLPDGRRYWRCLADSSRDPDEILLGWATCPPQKWLLQFKAGNKGTKVWNEYFDFWTTTTALRTNHPPSS